MTRLLFPSKSGPLALTLGLLSLTLACSGGGNGGGSAVSPTPTNVAPAITTQPVALTVKKGEAATFQVIATGTPAPTYQWRKGGIAIPGASGPSLSLTNVQPSDDAIYDVEVSNSAGKATSSPALLTVQYSPVITTQPAAVAVVSGNSATFTVKAEGKPVPTFQWKKNSAAISGATAATYTVDKTVPGDDGYLYTVDVTNSLGTVTSSPAKLTVDSGVATAPKISTDLQDQEVEQGKSVTFKIVATGTAPLTYKWYVDSLPWGNPTDTLIINNCQKNQTVKVEVTNSQGTVSSRIAKVTVNVPPGIPGINVGNLAADFSGQTWDGKTVSLSSLRGKIVVFEFSGWWCGWCQYEAPYLEKFFQEYKDKGVEVVTVLSGGTSMSIEADSADVKRWVDTFKLNFNVITDPKGYAWKTYRITGWPTNFVVNRNGVISAMILGGKSDAAIRAAVDALLK